MSQITDADLRHAAARERLERMAEQAHFDIKRRAAQEREANALWLWQNRQIQGVAANQSETEAESAAIALGHAPETPPCASCPDCGRGLVWGVLWGAWGLCGLAWLFAVPRDSWGCPMLAGVLVLAEAVMREKGRRK